MPDYRTYYDAHPDTRTPLVSCKHFTTSLLRLTKQHEMELAWLDSFVVIICTAGSGTVTDDKGNSMPIRQGETMLIPASAEGITILPENGMELLTSWID